LHFLLGALAYASSFIWLVLLVLSTADALGRALWPHDFFGSGYQLFPDWPIAKTGEIVSLLVITGALLLLPKAYGSLLCLIDRQRRLAFGGAGRMLASVLVEIMFSILIAPVMMLFHTYFVVTILGGRAVSWNPQIREDRSLGIHETTRYLLLPTLIGVAWGVVTFCLAPRFFWWLTPVLIGLGLSIPLVMWSSRVSVGRMLGRLGLFFTPEELTPPVELQDAQGAVAAVDSAPLSAASSIPVSTPPEVHGDMRPQSIEPAWSWGQKAGWSVSRSAT
jgi:membrane glycosyltransferase